MVWLLLFGLFDCGRTEPLQISGVGEAYTSSRGGDAFFPNENVELKYVERISDENDPRIYYYSTTRNE